MIWVLAVVFIQPWCSAHSLTRQYPYHLSIKIWVVVVKASGPNSAVHQTKRDDHTSPAKPIPMLIVKSWLTFLTRCQERYFYGQNPLAIFTSFGVAEDFFDPAAAID